jgi:flavin-dependent dehydrogenase
MVNDFLFGPYGKGWHIDRAQFNMLVAAAAQRAGTVFFNELRIGQCTSDRLGWTIAASHKDSSCALRCRFLVDATGRSPTGRFGFPKRTVFDRLIAIAGLSPPRAASWASEYTLVEAVEQGWFYSALLPCGEYILAYMTDADLYAAGRQHSTSYLEEQFARAPYTRERIACFPQSVAFFSAVTAVRESLIRDNWLAVGDAARSYDPLSGVGLLTAMSMASEAAPVIMRALDGDCAVAFDYERANGAAFDQYREARLSYYGLEARWPESEFWMRRRPRETYGKRLNRQ